MAARRLLALAILTLALPAQEGPAEPSSPQDAKPFVFEGRTLGGQALTQKDFEHNVVIVDLWGTWCPPCRKAVPHLVGLYQKYKHHGLEIIGFCYDRAGGAEDVEIVREFAAEQKITYPLLPGDKAVREQIEFSGYPTMLMFGRGMKLEHSHTGFDDDAAERIEKWVRKALGLDEKKGDEAAAEEQKEEVPEGKIFEPGNGDKGFELEVTDTAGEEFEFSSLRGKPVLLAMTTSWDQEAQRTARLLARLQKEHPGVHAVAWYLERRGDADEKNAVVRKFLEEQGVSYRAFTTPLHVTREKVHRFASLPTLLLFDAEGTLVRRENGISDEIEQRVLAAAAELADK